MTVLWDPRLWSIVSNLLKLGYQPHEIIYHWLKLPQYGTIFRLHLGSQTIVVLNSASVIFELLQDYSEKFACRPYLHMVHETLHGTNVVSAPHRHEFNEHKNFLIINFNRFTYRRRSALVESCLDEVRLESKMINKYDYSILVVY